MMRPILLLCAGRAAAFKSFSYKRDTVAASTLRELADKLPPVDFERSCYERAAVSDAVAAVFGVPSGTKVPMNTRLGPLEEHQDRPYQWAEDSGEGATPGRSTPGAPLPSSTSPRVSSHTHHRIYLGTQVISYRTSSTPC